jgi:RNA polymerase sigma-B factor
MTPHSPPGPDTAPAAPARPPTREAGERDELVRQHLRLAEHLARRFANRGIPLDDLVQVASLALVNAVDRYDPTRGTTFSTFATPTIVGEIKRHFRDRSWDLRVPRRVKELHLRLNEVVGRLNQQLGRSPTIAELAHATQASEEEVLEAIEAGHAFRAQTIHPTEGDREVLITSALAQHDDALHAADDRLLVAELLASLPPREQLIVRLRFFEGMTQDDIAARLGISQMHVSRLLARTLEFLRTQPSLQGELRRDDP